MDNKIKIRNEESKDFRIVENITREAFFNLYKEGCDEHFLIHKMRGDKSFIKELAFVLEYNNEIAGSIFYTHSNILLDSGEEYKTITFGPVSISPKYQKKSFGNMLINYSIEKTKELCYNAIIIQGSPNYYKKYGFVSAKKYNITFYKKFYSANLTLPLNDNALKNIKGDFYLAEIFYTFKNNEKEFEEYESTFPKKEKFITESQKDFLKHSQEIDNKEYN